MGIIFSKLQQYFYRKVDDLKQLAWNKVERTKESVRNRISSAKQSFCNKVVGAKDAVVGKIVDTKTTACTRVNNAATAVVVAARTTRDDVVCSICNKVRCVCDRVCAVRDGIYAAVASVKNAVTTRVNAAVSAVVRAKDAVVDCARRTTNATVERYCHSRDAICSRYYSIRNAKLTRWQKVKYGTLAVVILFILSVILLTLLDLYLEDYASAHYRLAVIWWCTCTAVQFVWDMSVIGATYAWYGTQFAAEKAWHGSKVAAHYGLVGAEIAGRQIYAGTLVTAHYAVIGTKIAAQYAIEGAEIVTRCTWIGCKHTVIIAYRVLLVLIDYAALCIQVCWEYTYAATLVGGHYMAEGGKLSAHYAAKCCLYAYEHGTTALHDGSVCFYHYAIYFVTNFRKASAEAAVWLWTTLQAIAVATCSAAYSGGQLLLFCTVDLVHKLYELTWLAGQWLYAAAVAAINWATITATNMVVFAKEFTIATVKFVISGCITAYSATVTTVSAIYSGSLSVSEWSVSTAKVTWSWLITTVISLSNFLYMAVTDYGFHWAVLVSSWLFDMACFLGHVLCKFFSDLGVYVANFVYVTSSRILSVVYIITSFLYSIAMAIASVIRIILDVVVFCTTRMFGAIIWFLRETLFAYMYMLHQYNVYRELLFLIFVGLLTVYCTGLMRDRRRLNEMDDAESCDDSEEEQLEDTITAEDGHTETVRSQSLKVPAQQHLMPSHEEVDDDLSDIELPDQIEDVEEPALEEEDLILSDQQEATEE